MPVRILPNGKIYIPGGKVSLAECCCDTPPLEVTGCPFEEFNPDIIADEVEASWPLHTTPPGGDFRGVTFTITDDWNGKVYAGAVTYVSPRSGENSVGSGSFPIFTLTDSTWYDYLELSCWSFDQTFSDWFAADEYRLVLTHSWNIVGPGGSGSPFQMTVHISEVGARQSYPEAPFWRDIPGHLTVVSRNPLHIIATFDPITLTYPADGGYLSSEADPGTVTIEVTE